MYETVFWNKSEWGFGRSSTWFEQSQISYQFEAHVKALESLYPRVPSIGCIGMSYDTNIVESGVSVIAFLDDISATANVLEQVSTMPVKYIERMEKDLVKIGASAIRYVLTFAAVMTPAY